MKMKPVGCNAPSRPAPWSWLNVFKESACKEKQQETDLIPIKPNGNPGEKDNKVPGERLLQYNVEIFKSALSYPDGDGDNLEFRSGKLFYFCRRFCSLIWTPLLEYCCPYLVLIAVIPATAELCCTLRGGKAPHFTFG